MDSKQKRMIQIAKVLSEGKAEIVKKINSAEQRANSRWYQMQTKPDGAERDMLERDMQALDAEALAIIWTVMQLGYDIQRDGIGTVTDIVSRWRDAE